MPKTKSSVSSRLRDLVLEFGEDVFTSDGIVLFCKVCNIKVNADKKYNIQQHIAREKHVHGIERKNKDKTKSQLLLKNMSSQQPTFNQDLCNAFLSSNIPLFKLNNPIFRNFMEKYTKQIIPDESTLRKNYVEKCYTNTIEKIRKYVQGKKIWISLDETTDVEGRYVANVIIGTLEIDEPGKCFLLNSDVLEKANHSTIVRLFETSLSILWPNGVLRDCVLIFVSDAAPYMVKAGKTIKVLYPKLEHITCLAHALHRVAEEVRVQFPEVNNLISTIKKVFLKSPYRVQIFKNIAPGISLPPEPILTRWGTWINACNYYCEHLNDIKKVISQLNPEDALSIKNAQSLVENSNIEANLVYIKANFGFLSRDITRLETSGMLLTESIGIIQQVKEKIQKAPGTLGKTIINKLENVLKKNMGFETFLKIEAILNGEQTSTEGLPEDLTSQDMVYFKYAPITSVDVERSFSAYKNILSDRRRRLKFENIRKMLIVQCNSDDSSKKAYILNINLEF